MTWHRPPYWKSEFCEAGLHPQCIHTGFREQDEGCTCDCHDEYDD